MKVLDLFSGIGGFSIGLERAGMETVAFCEIEKYPQRVLKHHWPGVPIYDDIRTITRKRLEADGIISNSGGLRRRTGGAEQPLQGPGSHGETRGDNPGKESAGTGTSIQLVCGGFPCQPFSGAGNQKGFEDVRDLWPEMFRVIQEVRPHWVIGENVAGFVSMGLERTIADLESEAFEVQPFIIPACAVGAPHQRQRIWIIAHTKRRGGGMFPGPLAGKTGTVQTGGKQFQPRPEVGNGGAGPGNVSNPKDKTTGGLPQRTGKAKPGLKQCGEDVAHPTESDNRKLAGTPDTGRQVEQRRNTTVWPEPAGRRENVSNPTKPGFQNRWGRPVARPGKQVQESQRLLFPLQDTESTGLERDVSEKLEGTGEGRPDTNTSRPSWRTTEPGLGDLADGFSQWLVEPDISRTAKGVNGRVDMLKALGNAVIPQIPELIGRYIMEIENEI